MHKFRRSSWLVSIWLLFTVSLATWWLIFGLRQVEVIQALEHREREQLERSQTMLLMEGSVLILSVFGGGLALFAYIRREQKRNQERNDFFGAFTHDLKTSITSLRLQAESLLEDSGAKQNPLLQRIVQDSVRLQVQLENSLYLANLETSRLLSENFSLQDTLESIRYHWPDLQIVLDGDCQLKGDRRAFESILRNLFHNSVQHAQADSIEIHVEKSGSQASIEFRNNGAPFDGDLRRLGQPFYRPGQSRGTGVGLYISRSLARKMGGDLVFTQDTARRLVAQMTLGVA